MIGIDQSSAVSINDQIKTGLRGLVARGLLKPGDPAPSIRNLAASLKVNPNTVARAFRELAAEGFIEARRGDGNYIAAGVSSQVRHAMDIEREALVGALRKARRGGLRWNEILDVLNRMKKEEPSDADERLRHTAWGR